VGLTLETTTAIIGAALAGIAAGAAIGGQLSDGTNTAMARAGIEPTTPRFSASLGVFECLRRSRFSLLTRGFQHFSDPRFSAVFGRRVDPVLT
jgi:hypothetical protein